jgi:hypothetical protein
VGSFLGVRSFSELTMIAASRPNCGIAASRRASVSAS